jgi:hypothetical protein
MLPASWSQFPRQGRHPKTVNKKQGDKSHQLLRSINSLQNGPNVLMGERSSLLTRIAATESGFIVGMDEKLKAFVELKSATYDFEKKSIAMYTNAPNAAIIQPIHASQSG